MNTKGVAVSTIVLAYSMFGVIGFISSMVSCSPITRVISSGLTFFSYACISVLSKRMSFRELFRVLMPLNLFNVIKSYADTGYMILKYRSMFGGLLDWGNEYFWLNLDAIGNNETLTAEFINKTKGPEFLGIVEKVNNTSNFLDHPYLSDINSFIEGIPTWVLAIIVGVILLYVAADFIIIFLSNMFTAITYPIIYVLAAFACIVFRLNVYYAYLIPHMWLPIAATVDSFLRIYILRALFFRFFKNHPLIASYAAVGLN